MRIKALSSLILFAALSGTFLIAQQPDGGPGGGPRPGMGMRPGLHLGPPGMWWHNPDLIQKLTLTPDQQSKMDGIFQQSRLQLIDLRAAVEKQEVQMEPLLSANPPDTNKVLAQIDQTAQARAQLEKANARMLLSIRGVLTSDQWTKLQAERNEHRGRRGPGGPGGRRGGGQGTPPAPSGGGEGMN
jgi:Spy/CpxP family protein refolding chaperone